MKVSKTSSRHISNLSAAERLKSKMHITSKAKIETADSSDSLCSFGRAIVNMQNNETEDSDERIFQLLDSIAQNDGYKAYRHHKQGNLIRSRAGELIPNWKDLYDEKQNLICYLDDNKNIDSIYVLDKESRAVNVYDSNGDIEKRFSPYEMKSIFEYKYYPEQFHDYLRCNRYRSMLSEDTLLNTIDTIDSLFTNPKLVYKTEKPTKVYRALQDNLSEGEKTILSTVGAVFRDNSFVSTTRELNTAKRFASNLIMEIELPKDSPYLDLDKLFNIDRERWREQECLLKRGSEFLITGYDKENNIIKAQYLNK